MQLAGRAADGRADRAGVARRTVAAPATPVAPARPLRDRRAFARSAGAALAALATVALATVLGAGPASAAPACEIEGEPVQWAADLCMLQLQTDDEIAASDCLAAEAKRRFADDCAARRHYKRRLCALSIRLGVRAGELAACVADRAFKGRTVAAGGVGA